MVGWLCAVGWQAAMATTAFATTQQLEGLIALNVPSYAIKGWHSTLLCIAITMFAIVWNTIFVRKLPLIEGVGLILHVFGFVTFIVVLWVMAPRSDPKTVWTKFEDNSGWGSVGLSTLVGILGPMVTLIGSDSSCHLSEELKDAAWVLPRAMVATAIVNYAMGFVMTVTIMSTLGSDIPAILGTRFGQPWIQVLFNATESQAGTSVMTAILCLLLLFCSVNQITTSSRQLFAFARDKGLPFSSFLAKVSATHSPLKYVLEVTNISLGAAWLGRPRKRRPRNPPLHHTALAHHRRFYGRLQCHHISGPARTSILIHCGNRLRVCEACARGTASTLSLQSWKRGDFGERHCIELSVASIHLSLLSRGATSNACYDELELVALRVYRLVFAGLLLCVGETQLCGTGGISKAPVVAG